MRVYYFNYAVLHYNMWTAANVLHAVKIDHDLKEDRKAFTADDIISAISEDQVELILGESDDLSEYQNVLERLDSLSGFATE